MGRSVRDECCTPSVGGSTVGGHRLSSKLLGARHLCGSVLASDIRVLDAVSGGFERRLGRPREEPPTFALVSAIASGFFGVKSTCLQVTADAGSNKSVASAGSVRLDGSATVQNGAGSTTYAWSRVSGTGGSLSSASAASPTFTAPTLAAGAANRVITWRLTVTNNGVSDTDDVSVTVTAPALTAPGTPASLSGSLTQASVGANAQGTARWTVPTSGGTPTGYVLEHFVGTWVRTGTGYGDVGDVLSSQVAFATEEGVDLVGNNQAHRVRAYNAAGSSGWRQVDFQVSRS